MGHSKSINEIIYQTPLAEVEVADIGSILQKFGEMLHIVKCIRFTVYLCIRLFWNIIDSMRVVLVVVLRLTSDCNLQRVKKSCFLSRFCVL